MKLIDADKLKERVVDLKFTTEGIKTVIDLIDELSEEMDNEENDAKYIKMFAEFLVAEGYLINQSHLTIDDLYDYWNVN